jgi:NADPH:quinone reductase
MSTGIRSLNWDGRAVVVGFAGGGDIPRIPANILLVKNVSVNGLYWGAHAKANPKLFAESTKTVVDMWAAGKIKPHVSHRFPLSQANKAFQTIMTRQTTGKVILVPEE